MYCTKRGIEKLIVIFYRLPIAHIHLLGLAIDGCIKGDVTMIVEDTEKRRKLLMHNDPKNKKFFADIEALEKCMKEKGKALEKLLKEKGKPVTKPMTENDMNEIMKLVHELEEACTKVKLPD